MSTFEGKFQYEVGDRGCRSHGTVMVRQETQYGLKYIAQPDNPRAAAVRTLPDYVVDVHDDEPKPAEDAEAAVAA